MGRSFVRIQAPTKERLMDLQQVYALDIFPHTAKQLSTGFEVDGLLTDEQIKRLKHDGYTVEITGEADDVAKERLKEVRRKSETD